MPKIKYVVGDATDPPIDGTHKIIAHICNDIGVGGKGFVMALSTRWQEPEIAYRKWYKEKANNDFGLGQLQFVRVEPELLVANMIAQKGTRGTIEGPPIRYDALQQCLQSLAVKAREVNGSIHMPRIGCGLAGGNWGKVSHIVMQEICQAGVRVFVYDFQ